MYKFCVYTFSVLLNVYLGVELLGHVIILCLTFCETVKLFAQDMHHFTFPPAMYKGSNCPTFLPTLVIFLFFKKILEIG